MGLLKTLAKILQAGTWFFQIPACQPFENVNSFLAYGQLFPDSLCSPDRARRPSAVPAPASTKNPSQSTEAQTGCSQTYRNGYGPCQTRIRFRKPETRMYAAVGAVAKISPRCQGDPLGTHGRSNAQNETSVKTRHSVCTKNSGPENICR